MDILITFVKTVFTMKDRIIAFLQNENKSHAQFAEEIGVQPSGISHIISGRNNPSLDFVIKMLHRYPALSADWLLFGHGSMYKYVDQPTLFDEEPENIVSKAMKEESGVEVHPQVLSPPERPENGPQARESDNEQHEETDRRLSRVLFFYSDKTFTEYMPS
jgi:transcriptional regulator with XRE-family HTH domain